jgi:hypothetical protein
VAPVREHCCHDVIRSRPDSLTPRLHCLHPRPGTVVTLRSLMT